MGELLETILNSSACPITAEDIHGSVGARDSAVHGARLGRDACAHGRIHGSVVTHGLVAHRLHFMDD